MNWEGLAERCAADCLGLADRCVADWLGLADHIVEWMMWRAPVHYVVDDLASAGTLHGGMPLNSWNWRTGVLLTGWHWWTGVLQTS